MKCIITSEGHTVQELAQKFYQTPRTDSGANAAQSNPNDSLERIVAAIKQASGIHELSTENLGAGRRVFLPPVENVEPRVLRQEFWQHTKRYITLAVVLAAVWWLTWAFLDLIYQVAKDVFQGMGDGPVRTFALQTMVAHPLTAISFLQVILVFGLILFVIWFHGLVKNIGVNATLVFFVMWLVGAAVFLVLANLFAYWVSLTALANSFVDPVDFLACWTVLVGIFYVVVGDSTKTYLAYIKEHKEIYVSFLLTILYTFVVLNYTYDYISFRIDGVLAPRQLLVSHLNDAAVALNRAEALTTDLDKQLTSETLPQEETLKGCALNSAPSAQGTLTDGTVANVATNAPNFLNRSGLYPICAYIASAAASTQAALALYDGVEQSEKDLAVQLGTASGTNTSIVQPGSSVGWTRIAAQDSLTLTMAVQTSLQHLDDALAPAGLNASDITTPTEKYRAAGMIVAHELLPQIRLANAAAADVSSAARGLEIDPRPIFNGSALLLVLFVLFPWFLLLLFFLRKRTSLSSDIVKDLIRLAPEHALLNRVLGLMRVEKGARAGTDTAPYTTDVLEGNTQMRGMDREQIRRQITLVESVRALPVISDGMIQGKSIKQAVVAYENVKNAIANYAFSDLEYVLAITLLSGAFAVGWYFVLYPQTTIGLAQLILENSGIVGFARYLQINLTPITAGFVGAYMWSTFTLLRRYYYGDLYPAAYLAALERVIRVFVITLILTVASNLVGIAPALLNDPKAAHSAILLLSFFIGIFPQVGLTFLGDLLNRLLSPKIPTLEQRAPLTELDGMDYYFEGRLLEEKIENIQGMATAQIEDLVVNTFFPAKRIVDWIDQAILYIHCGRNGEWFMPLRGAGIRTASDLLDALGYKFQDLNLVTQESRTPHPTLVKRLVDAVAGGQVARDTRLMNASERLQQTTRTYRMQLDSISSLVQELDELGKNIPETTPAQEAQAAVTETIQALRTKNKTLGADLSAFPALSGKVESDFKAMNLPAAETEMLKSGIANVAKSVQALKKTTTGLTTELDAIKLDAPETLAAGAGWRGTIANGAQAGKDLEEKMLAVYTPLNELSATAPLSKEIVQEIYDTILPDPNMTYVLYWNSESYRKETA